MNTGFENILLVLILIVVEVIITTSIEWGS